MSPVLIAKNLSAAVRGLYWIFFVFPIIAAANALHISTSKPSYLPSLFKKLKPGIFPLTPHIS